MKVQSLIRLFLGLSENKKTLNKELQFEERLVKGEV